MYLYTADGNPSGELIYPVQVDNHLNGTDIDQGSAGETQREQCDHPGHTQSCSERVSCQGSDTGQHGNETAIIQKYTKKMKKWYMKMTKQSTEDERKSVENYEEEEPLEEQNMQETEQGRDRSKEVRQKGLS